MLSVADEALVLRTPEQDGNYSYRVAALSIAEANHWERLLADADPDQGRCEVSSTFGPAMDLAGAMDRLRRVRNFKVIDISTPRV